jgi:hypothetical protein
MSYPNFTGDNKTSVHRPIPERAIWNGSIFRWAVLFNSNWKIIDVSIISSDVEASIRLCTKVEVHIFFLFITPTLCNTITITTKNVLSHFVENVTRFTNNVYDNSSWCSYRKVSKKTNYLWWQMNSTLENNEVVSQIQNPLFSAEFSRSTFFQWIMFFCLLSMETSFVVTTKRQTTNIQFLILYGLKQQQK